MSKKAFVLERNKALYSLNGTLGITFLKNIPQIELHQQMTVAEFARWNKEQEEKHDWWIATEPFYRLQKIVSYFGYDLDQFTVYMPKVPRPIIFALDDMCFIVAPFCGYLFKGMINWRDQPQETDVKNP